MFCIKSDKQTQLLRILSDAGQSISAATLANMLGTSERTVRNYIKALNDDGRAVILSTRQGYRLASRPAPIESSPTENEARLWKVLSDLLTSKDGINAFDEADALFVSSSTVINSIIPQIKAFVRDYGLRVESQKYHFYLRGSEQQKRKMIGSLAVRNTYGFFSTQNALEQLFPAQDIHGIMQRLFSICQQSQLFLNDFALNNLLVHILIILIRLNFGDESEDPSLSLPVEELLDTFQDKNEIIALADRIAESFQQAYKLQIPQRDYRQILVLIALSVEHEMVEIQRIIQPEFVQNVTAVLSMVSQRYCTPAFSNDFILQFSLHMYYAQQRCAFHISYPNPIAQQFKKDYAPIYDMAVCFAHHFAQIYHIEFNEDEIAFIAFHIGSYLENNKQNQDRITCVIVVESYHALARQLVSQIHAEFSAQLVVLEVLPVNRFLSRQPTCDLVLSALPLSIRHPHLVPINPLLTKTNRDNIRAELESISAERELEHAQCFLRDLLRPELYFRNIELPDERAYIQYMGEHCVREGCASPAFVQDVLLRESFSSTAFTDALAVPHALSQFADRSFVCIIHNDMPIRWKIKTVHFVLMIGISEQDMKNFKPAFDLIVELFNSSARTLELLKTDTFEDFCAQLK